MEKVKKRCSKCKSTQVYIRIKSNELVCQSCGFIEKFKVDNINGNN